MIDGPMISALGPSVRASRAQTVDRLYSIVSARRSSLLYADAERIAQGGIVDELLDPLESDCRLFVAERARRRIFVHAGALGWRGRAILIPGRSFSGKSSLTAALVRLGARYYSDEYAVLDERGRLHPYPAKLSLRNLDGSPGRRIEVEEMGGRRGRAPIPVGAIIVCRFRAGARFRPRRQTRGQAVLALMANTVPARSRPEMALRTLERAADAATTLRGTRGDADEAARVIVDRLGP